MAEDPVVGNEAADDIEATGIKTAAIDLKKAVKAVVAQKHSDGEVRKIVIEQLAQEQINDRVALLRRALIKRDELAKKLDQIRPDMVSYDANGKKFSEAYSKGKVEERKKADEELNKADKAINKAVDESDYELAKKLVGG